MFIPVMSATARGAFVACILLPLLALTTVVLRICARLRTREKLGADDYTMAVALFIAMGTCAILAYALFIGAAMGPPSSITGNSVVLTYELDIIIEQLYGIAEALVKIAILLFYRRVFATSRFRLVVHWSIGFVSLWALLFLLLFVFPVWPISTSWIPKQHSHQNYDWTKVLLWHAITNIGLDLYVLSLPIPTIRKLHMTRGRKFAIVSIMWLGSFCVIASCIRLSYTVGVLSEKVDTAGAGNDAVSETALWSVIEPCCSVIAGCLPTLGPLVKGSRVAEWMSSKARSMFPVDSQKVEFMSSSFIASGASSTRRGSHESRWHLHWPGSIRSPQRSRQASATSMC